MCIHTHTHTHRHTHPHTNTGTHIYSYILIFRSIQSKECEVKFTVPEKDTNFSKGDIRKILICTFLMCLYIRYVSVRLYACPVLVLCLIFLLGDTFQFENNAFLTAGASCDASCALNNQDYSKANEGKKTMRWASDCKGGQS